MTTLAVAPSRSRDRREAAWPQGVAGPRDLHPLMREISALCSGVRAIRRFTHSFGVGGVATDTEPKRERGLTRINRSRAEPPQARASGSCVLAMMDMGTVVDAGWREGKRARTTSHEKNCPSTL
jgi:hypothetical protein